MGVSSAEAMERSQSKGRHVECSLDVNRVVRGTAGDVWNLLPQAKRRWATSEPDKEVSVTPLKGCMRAHAWNNTRVLNVTSKPPPPLPLLLPPLPSFFHLPPSSPSSLLPSLLHVRSVTFVQRQYGVFACKTIILIEIQHYLSFVDNP